MNKELNNMIKRIRNTPIKRFGRLNYSYVRITVLFDYIKVINDNGNELITPANKQAIATGQEPAIQLYDYLILEICSFYDYIKILKKKNPTIEFPELPNYLGKIYAFRNAIPGHVDKYERLSTGEDFINIYQPIFRDIGVEKISIDLENYYEECTKRFGKELI